MHIYKLSDPDFWQKRGPAYAGGGGIYVIRCLEINAQSESGPYVPIHRILEQDSDGVLYIGKANGQGRLATLLMSIDPRYKGVGHSLGIRYKADERFAKLFPYSSWVIELIASEDPNVLEREYLNRYEAKFGELPPFNHSKRKGL